MKKDICPKCKMDRNNEHERDGTYLCWCPVSEEEELSEATVPKVRNDEVPSGLRRGPDSDPEQD